MEGIDIAPGAPAPGAALLLPHLLQIGNILPYPLAIFVHFVSLRPGIVEEHLGSCTVKSLTARDFFSLSFAGTKLGKLERRQ